MYTSVSRMQGSAIDQMLRIRQRAAANNGAHGVHTALYLGGGRILQWLEGPRGEVHAALARATRDTRHAAQALLHESEGPRTLGDVWMLRANNHHPVTMPMPTQPHTPPLALWEHWTAPWTGFAAGGEAPPFSRVLLLAADSDQNFAAVQGVASRWRTRVVHERYAIGTANSPDTGGCYTDVEYLSALTGLQRIRFHALARRSLRHQLLASTRWDLVLMHLQADSLPENHLLEQASRRFGHDHGAPRIVFCDAPMVNGTRACPCLPDTGAPAPVQVVDARHVTDLGTFAARWLSRARPQMQLA